MVKNGPPFKLMRASFTDNYELITFLIPHSSTYGVMIEQLQAGCSADTRRDRQNQI